MGNLGIPACIARDAGPLPVVLADFFATYRLWPEAEFKDKCLSTARSVIEPCLVKAGYEPCLRTGFFREIFLFQRHSISITAQSVID